MLDGLINIILMLIKIIGIILLPFIFIIFIIFIIIFFKIVYKKIKGSKLPLTGKFKKRSIFKRLFIDFPNQFTEDIFNKEDYEFNEYGLHMVCGEQGSGKTTTVVYLLNKWKQQYPKCRIATNMYYKYQNAELTNYKGVIGRTNGKNGQIEVIDEIQTWFSSLQSKNFPPEMLSEISQQRKQRKCILGTAQVFSRIAKPIREQTHFVYLPVTFLGCITFVRKSHIKYWNDDKQKFTRYLGFFFFIHNKEIRDSFDTYKKIEKYKNIGFKSDLERGNAE